MALFTIMKLARAGYLMFPGVQAIRHRRSLVTALGADGLVMIGIGAQLAFTGRNDLCALGRVGRLVQNLPRSRTSVPSLAGGRARA